MKRNGASRVIPRGTALVFIASSVLAQPIATRGTPSNSELAASAPSSEPAQTNAGQTNAVQSNAAQSNAAQSNAAHVEPASNHSAPVASPKPLHVGRGETWAASESPKPDGAAPAPTHVRFDAWFARLLEVLDTVEAPTVEREFGAFAAGRGLDVHDVDLRRDFRRLRLLFEATRDGGFWHLRWDITNQKPSSRRIWQQWSANAVATNFGIESATAECDESSALLGMLAKHARIANVGLFYPTRNHTIAVWAPLAGKRKVALVQLPTSQIFLGCDAGFDRTTFETKRTNVQAYPAFDLRPHSLLPAPRGEWLIEQVRRYAGGSAELWALLRAQRAVVLQSSMRECNDQRAKWAETIARARSPEDERILMAVGAEELEMPSPTVKQVLTWLALRYPVLQP